MWERTDVIRIAMRTPTDQLPTACNVKKLNNFEEKSTNVMKIRIPLTVDIAFHIVSTSHGKFAPIQDTTGVDIQNISLKREFSKSIIKQWKKMALNEEIDVKKYKDPRACLRCNESFNDPVDMFKHIKVNHM